jgi:hypothetical protein
MPMNPIFVSEICVIMDFAKAKGLALIVQQGGPHTFCHIQLLASQARTCHHVDMNTQYMPYLSSCYG